MRTRSFIIGALLSGVVLIILNWLTAAILPPRFKQFKDPNAVINTVRDNVSENGIYTAPEGLFVAASFSARPRSFGSRIVGQFTVEFGVAFGLALLAWATGGRSPQRIAGTLGVAGMTAGVETHFPNWNWEGFPTSYLLAGTTYLTVNWFLAGLALAIVWRKLEEATPRSSTRATSL